MDEKKLKLSFMDQISDFGNLVGLKNPRLYAFEFSTFHGEKTYYADMVLEDDIHDHQMDNDLYILEFKDGEILHSALDQLNLYCDLIPKQLYRRGTTTGVLVSSVGFSEWEAGEAKKQGRKCVLYDGQNMKVI